MADVASKQQTIAMFLSTIVTRTRKHTELTRKMTNLMGYLCCAREHSVQFFVQFFTQTAQFNVDCVGPFRVSWECSLDEGSPMRYWFDIPLTLECLTSGKYDEILCQEC